MNLNDKTVNELFNISISYVDNTLKEYNYDEDIVHLLYIIIPAFIVKYGLDSKNKILKVFKQVPIVIKKNDEQILQAYYASIPIQINDIIMHLIL